MQTIFKYSRHHYHCKHSRHHPILRVQTELWNISKGKKCRVLRSWMPSISNMLWWSFSTSVGMCEKIAWSNTVAFYISYRGPGGVDRENPQHNLSYQQQPHLPWECLPQEVQPWGPTWGQRQGVDQARQLCSEEAGGCHQGEEQLQAG